MTIVGGRGRGGRGGRGRRGITPEDEENSDSEGWCLEYGLPAIAGTASAAALAAAAAAAAAAGGSAGIAAAAAAAGGGNVSRGVPGKVCCECGATQTPQWREGPMGESCYRHAREWKQSAVGARQQQAALHGHVTLQEQDPWYPLVACLQCSSLLLLAANACQPVP